MRFLQNWKLLLPLLCIAAFAAIFLLSSQAHSAQFTGKIFGEYNFIARKAAHFSEFAAATLLLYATLRSFVPRWIPCRCGALSGLVCVAYAFLDEFHQVFVPGRTPSLTDVFIDSCGVIAMLALIACWQAVGSPLHKDEQR